jgi:hypothetical protein
MGETEKGSARGKLGLRPTGKGVNLVGIGGFLVDGRK